MSIWDGIAGIAGIAGNIGQNYANSAISWHYQRKQMAAQDKYQRAFAKDQYSLQREGLEAAGYNPLLALGGGSAATEPMSVGSSGGDSRAGSDAVNNAIAAAQFRVQKQQILSDVEKNKSEADYYKSLSKQVQQGININKPSEIEAANSAKFRSNFPNMTYFGDILNDNSAKAFGSAAKSVGKGAAAAYLWKKYGRYAPIILRKLLFRV